MKDLYEIGEIPRVGEVPAPCTRSSFGRSGSENPHRSDMGLTLASDHRIGGCSATTGPSSTGSDGLIG